MHPETVGLIVNRAPKGELNDGIKEEIEKQGLHLLGVVPQDETVYEYDCVGRPTAALPDAYYIHRSALQFCQLPEFLFWSSH